MKAVEQISFLEAVVRQQDERIEQLEAALELVRGWLWRGWVWGELWRGG